MDYLNLTPSALQIIQKFNDWKKSYDKHRYLYYIFSPEWDEFQRVQYEEYEHLIRLLEATGTPAGPWKGSLEKRKREAIQDKAATYQPLEEDHRHLCPLSIHLDKYLGRNSQDRQFPWKTALSSWAKFRELYHADASDLRSSLSPTQLSSYMVLEHWWSSAYCEDYLVKAARSFMQERVDMPDTSDPGTNSALEDNADARMTDHSLYHAQCYELFIHEFHPQLWEPYVSHNYLKELLYIRTSIAQLASIQRLAYSFSRSDVSYRPANTELLRYPKLDARTNPWIMNSKFEDTPYYLWDRESRRTVIFSDIPDGESRDYVCISHTWGRWRVDPPADITGVRWPVPTNSRFDVQELPQILAEIQLGCRYIWLDLFCIPQRTSIRTDLEIAKQASIFKKSRKCIAWLNDIESWDGLKSTLAWVSRIYFEHTTRPNLSIPPESPQPKACPGVGPEVELPSESIGLLRPVTTSSEEIEGDPQELIGWFTSLWTLQESILCPDMELCDRGFTTLKDKWDIPISLRCLILAIDDCKEWCYLSAPIQERFSGRAYILGLSKHSLEFGRQAREFAKERWPHGLRELATFNSRTALSKTMRNQPPALVFSRALMRQCTGSRAPAIMSALGVTDWYEKRIAQQSEMQSPVGGSQECLLFGMYPLDFVQEALLKLGASLLGPMTMQFGLDEETMSALRKREIVGSLISFARRDTVEVGIIGGSSTLLAPRDHPAVRTWTILHDGSVRINQAGIVASSIPVGEGPCSTSGYKLKARMFLGGNKNAPLSIESDDLGEKLRSLAGEHHLLYAVCLFQDRQLPYGVMLLGSKSSPQCRNTTEDEYLVRIGNFQIEPELYHKPIFVQDTRVKWIIL